ncbi:hypothetical protein M8J75_013733 [Diaphorina citri]|nr:hypothetical protein M8J75_013733 [Diaphorina citri]
MPVINGGRGGGPAAGAGERRNSNQPEQRQTFRPPWVKDAGPQPLPMPSAPWVASKRNSLTPEQQDPHSFQKPVLRKVDPVPEKKPSSNGAEVEPAPIKKLKPILKKQQNSIAQEPTVPLKVMEDTWKSPQQKPAAPTPQTKTEPPQPKTGPPQNKTGPPQPKTGPPQNKTGPPPPPPMMPGPPPPPPPAPPTAPPLENKAPLSETQKKRIEQLKSRPRRRPDWSDMMKEVEQGKKLRHVQCNDRSAPIISFVFESEKKDVDAVHNALLSEIQQGVKLRKVKVNDRSKPNLSGLRKFRRQMTVDEKIQKSMSMADVVAAAVEPDELDDIDKVRDDLQSAKQMLALELRNKETLERENKKLAAKVAALEAELEKEKQMRQQDAGTKIVKMKTDEDELLIKKLKEENEEAERANKEMEERYKASAEELDNTRRKLESAWLLNQELENQLKSVQQHAGNMIPIMKQPSRKLVMQNTLHGKSIEILSSDEDEDSDEEESETESEEESDTEDNEAKEEKRQGRELKMLNNKLKTYRDKHQRARTERKSLRGDVKQQQRLLKEEKKKYKVLQKEVDKMAKLMKDNEGDEDEEEDEEDPKEDEDEETESESESESEDSSDEVSEADLPESAPFDQKKLQLSNRAKKHETRLNSLKKGNYLLKANIDRLQDDLIRQRDMSLALQEDLNSVLAELG